MLPLSPIGLPLWYSAHRVAVQCHYVVISQLLLAEGNKSNGLRGENVQPKAIISPNLVGFSGPRLWEQQASVSSLDHNRQVQREPSAARPPAS